MWSSGTGSEIMQRIAVPMIGGMVPSTVLTLIVMPAVFAVVKGWNFGEVVHVAPKVIEGGRQW